MDNNEDDDDDDEDWPPPPPPPPAERERIRAKSKQHSASAVLLQNKVKRPQKDEAERAVYSQRSSREELGGGGDDGDAVQCSAVGRY